MTVSFEHSVQKESGAILSGSKTHNFEGTDRKCCSFVRPTKNILVFKLYYVRRKIGEIL